MAPRLAMFAAVFAALLAHAGTAQAVGVFSVSPLTGDVDSGISAGSAFSLAIDLNDDGNRTVNDAVFTGSGFGVAAPATNNYSVSGTDGLFSGNVSDVTGSTGDLLDNFIYNGNPQVVRLENLRVGEQYVTTFYNSSFGNPRISSIAASDGGLMVSYDQTSDLLQYSFTATTNSLNFTITPAVPAVSFHAYAFSNVMPNYTALLTDNFYAPANPNTGDVNFNVSDRQGGTLNTGVGFTAYSTDGGNVQVGNTSGGIDGGNYALSAASGKLSPEFNFNNSFSQGGLLISFDMAPNVASNIDTSVWGAINLGMDVSQRYTGINGFDEHFGILFRGNGQIQAFDGSSLVSGAETWTSLTNVTTDLHHFELLLTDPTDGNPFDGVGQTDIDVYADGLLVYSYTKTGGGYDQNYLNFMGLEIAGFDNLLIAQANAVPEPSSLALALLGLVGLGGCAWRRRGR